MLKMTFSMSLSTEKYLQFYQGTAKNIIVKADDGRTLKFPADRLQQFVTRDGVEGIFEILFDDEHKIISLNKLA